MDWDEKKGSISRPPKNGAAMEIMGILRKPPRHPIVSDLCPISKHFVTWHENKYATWHENKYATWHENKYITWHEKRWATLS